MTGSGPERTQAGDGGRGTDWYAAKALRLFGSLSLGMRIGLDRGFNSWEYVEYVYANRPSGRSLLERTADRLFLAHPRSAGLRVRHDMVVEQLLTAIENYEEPVVFDMGAGNGTYLFHVSPGRARIVAGDISRTAREAGASRAAKAGRDDMTFEVANAFNPRSYPVDRADVLVTSGLLNSFPDAWARKIVAHASRIVGAGGRWVFTTFLGEERSPRMRRWILRTAIESSIDSSAHPRAAVDVAEWAAPFGWVLERTRRDSMFEVATLIRQGVVGAGERSDPAAACSVDSG